MKFNHSYWEYDSFYKDIDTVVIGGGIVGLSAAIHIKRQSPSQRVTILERGALPIGASTRNAGFACIGSISEIMDDLSQNSENEVMQLVERRYKGLLLLRSLLGDEKIDYQPCGGYEIFRSNESETYQSCQEQISYLNQILNTAIGIKDCYTVANASISGFGLSDIDNMILNNAEGSLDTGKMIKSLIQLALDQGVKIFNGTDVAHVESTPNNVIIRLTNDVEIKANKALITTNAFAKDLISNLNLQTARNQVIITNPINNLKLKGTFHYDRGFIYFRNVGNRVLIGGGRNLDLKSEETPHFGTTEHILDNLNGILSNIILPDTNYEIDHTWSGIMGVGDNKAPILEMHSSNIGVAVRLGGMGVALGSLVGKEAAEMMLS